TEVSFRCGPHHRCCLTSRGYATVSNSRLVGDLEQSRRRGLRPRARPQRRTIAGLAAQHSQEILPLATTSEVAEASEVPKVAEVDVVSRLSGAPGAPDLCEVRDVAESLDHREVRLQVAPR